MTPATALILAVAVSAVPLFAWWHWHREAWKWKNAAILKSVEAARHAYRAHVAEAQISDILARLESGEEFAVEVAVLDDGTRQLQGLTTTQVGDGTVH